MDQLSLDLGEAGALDVTRLVGPVQPVSVPVEIEGQDAVVGSEELILSGVFAFELQQVDTADGGVYKPRIWGTTTNRF